MYIYNVYRNHTVSVYNLKKYMIEDNPGSNHLKADN